MKTKFCAFLLLLTLGGGAHAATLSDTAQVAMLSKKIIAAYTAEDYATTTKLFMEYDQLDAALPLPLMLVRVQAYYHLGEFVAAYPLLSDYLNLASPDSPDYDTALDMYIALEAKPGVTEAIAKAEAEAKVKAKFAAVVGRQPSTTNDLHYVVEKNFYEAVALLLKVGVNDRHTPLHEAAGNNAVATVTLLVERGAAVNAKDNDGDTPLHYAAGKNAVATVTLLVERDAAVNAKDHFGHTPLHEAAGNNAVATVTLLVERGATVNAKDHFGHTPLHFAAFGNAVATATLLVERGAAVNAKDDDGWTPLHFAACSNAVATATLLIERGAAVNAKDHYGNTSLDYTTLFGADTDETAALLRQHGGKE